MRWVYLTVIILFAAATLLFVLQNFDAVIMSILGFQRARTSSGYLIAVVYLVGGVTGGSLFALLVRSYTGSRRN